MAAQSKHWLSKHVEDKKVRYPLIILFWAIVCLLLFLIGKSFLGYNVNFFGMQTNPSKPKTDTVIIKEPVYTPKDTVPNKSVPITNKPVSEVRSQQKKTDKPIDTTPTIRAKNVNTGTNNGVIGDNGTMNINTEKQLTEEEKIAILDFVKKTMKEKNINCLGFTSSQGSNGGTFLSQLKAALIKEGYNLDNGLNSISLTPTKGVSFQIHLGCLDIIVGTF